MHYENIEMKGYFKSPSNIMLCSPSGTGKTQISLQILKHKEEMFEITPKKLIICYSIWQEAYDAVKQDAIFFKGIPTRKHLEDWAKAIQGHSVLVLDDLLNDMLTSKNLPESEAIFTKYGHHLNMSVIVLSQNIFWKNLRTISLQIHYFILLPVKITSVSTPVLRFFLVMCPSSDPDYGRT